VLFYAIVVREQLCYTQKMKKLFKNITNKKQKLLQLLLIVSIVSVVIFSGMLIREILIDKQSQSFYEGILGNIETRPRVEEQNSGQTPGQQTGQGEGFDVLPGDEWQPYVDFDALSSIFPGIVGWIKSPDSPIDYPVMQHTNNDYFLARLPDGTRHRSGSIFLDYRNSSDFSDKSILIYGHESHEREMFGSLKNYRRQDYYNDNPIIHLYTPLRDFEIVIFAVHLAHSENDHPPLRFNNDAQFLTYVEHLKSISLIRSNVIVESDEQIISLCTCAYDFDEARLVVVGVLR